jgi:transcriptional regulator with XRE-family HTH domain
MSVNNAYTLGMTKKHEDPVMSKVRSLFDKSGLSLHDLGIKMECSPESARQSVWQFMKTSDPHISVLRRFARALDVPLADLLDEKKSRSK